jgi:predicted porin
VTLYGVADGGLRFDHTNIGTLKAVSSGGAAGSRWGLRGSEDLGDGWKANFIFEQGFDLSDNSVPQGSITGATPTTNTSSSGSRIFSRISTVGLSSPYGSVRFGRDYKPTFLTYAIYEPFGAGYVATAGNIAIRNVARYDNAVYYESPRLYGLQVTGVRAFGESTTNATPGTPSQAGDKYGLGASYLVGAFTAAYGFGNEKGVTTTPLIGNSVNKNVFNDGSVTYDFGFVKLAAIIWKVQDELGFKMRNYHLGATVPFGAWTFLGGWGRIDDRGSSNPAVPSARTNYDAKFFGGAARYSLSKRTSLYASYARFSIDNGGAYFIADSNAPATGLFTPANIVGINPYSYQVGISHQF